MKLKFLALSVALVATLSANAQTESKHCDLFVGAGVGAMSVMTPGLNTPTFYANIQLGKYITPAFAVRGVVGGISTTLDPSEYNAALSVNPDGTLNYYGAKGKHFVEFNADAMLSISNLFSEEIAKLDFYVFGGPTINVAREGTRIADTQEFERYVQVEYSSAVKARIGATAGLGLAYNFSKNFALGLEARFGVTPSSFGYADAYRYNSGTGRLTLQGVWNIGGRRSKLEKAIAAAAAIGYISPAAAQALVDEAVEKNPKVVEKLVEKEVIKYVEKEVKSEVPATTAIFFGINKYSLESKDKARVNLLAEAIINGDQDAVYEVGGYADKKTGSAKTNQRISEKRAQTVYDALIAAGVPAEKLEKKAYGGVSAMFFNNDLLSRTVIIKRK